MRTWAGLAILALSLLTAAGCSGSAPGASRSAGGTEGLKVVKEPLAPRQNGRVEIRMATTEPTKGFTRVVLPSRVRIYVSPEVALNENDLKSAQILYIMLPTPSPSGEEKEPAVALAFTRNGARQLESFTRNENRMAIYADGRFVATMDILRPITDGKMLIAARFTEMQAQRLCDAINHAAPKR